MTRPNVIGGLSANSATGGAGGAAIAGGGLPGLSQPGHRQLGFVGGGVSNIGGRQRRHNVRPPVGHRGRRQLQHGQR